MVRIKVKGDWKKVDDFFERLVKEKDLKFLERYGEEGVAALSVATPKDTGLTALSWSYDIKQVNQYCVKVYFKNSNVQDGISIALILQYGHGTRNGGYVIGRDYINPAIQPLFDEMADKAWKEVAGLE